MSDLEWKIIQRKHELKASIAKSFEYNDFKQTEERKVSQYNVEDVDEKEEQSFLDIDMYADYDSLDIQKLKYSNSFTGTMATNQENNNIESLSKT